MNFVNSCDEPGDVLISDTKMGTYWLLCQIKPAGFRRAYGISHKDIVIYISLFPGNEGKYFVGLLGDKLIVTKRHYFTRVA